MSSYLDSLKSMSLSNSEGYTDPSVINVFQMDKSVSSSLCANLPKTPSSEASVQMPDIDFDADLEVEWNDLEISGLWGYKGLEINSWDDEERPLVKLKSYGELQLSEGEKKGILTYKTLASCASYLDRNPITKKYVICKYNLSNKLLRDISLLKYFHYVQYLDLSWNELTNLEPLSQMPFLMYLNASHNNINEVLAFKAPFYLTHVDLSFNLITRIPDLSDFWSIATLNLSHNKISVIEGMQNLRYLRFLNLSYNELSTVENLNNMRIQTLSLHHNVIYKFEDGPNIGIKTLRHLKRIKLSHNHICSLKFLENTLEVQEVILRENDISSLLELYYLKELRYLTSIDFRGNQFTEIPQYNDVCMDAIKQLMFLDGEYINNVQKIEGRDKFSNEPRVLATAQIAKTVLLKQLNNTNICLPVFPYTNMPPPLLILVGPPASKKAHILKILASEMPQRAVLGVSYTTRPKLDDEVKDEDYHYVSREEFHDLLLKGEFLTEIEIFGHSYGFRESELTKIINKGILVFHTDLSAALSLRAKNLKPVLVLAMPRSEMIHMEWLEKRYRAQEIVAMSEIDMAETASLSSSGTLSGIGQFITPPSSELIRDPQSKEEVGSIQCDIKDRVCSITNMGTSILRKEEESKCLKVKDHPSVTFKTQRVSSGDIKDLVEVEVFHSSADSCINPNAKSASEAVMGTCSTPVLSALSDVHFQQNVYGTSKVRGVVVSAYYQDVLEMRKIYLQTHLENPGLFTRVIFTDEPGKSLEVLKELLSVMCQHHHVSYTNMDLQQDPAHNIMAIDRRNKYLEFFKTYTGVSSFH